MRPPSCGVGGASTNHVSGLDAASLPDAHAHARTSCTYQRPLMGRSGGGRCIHPKNNNNIDRLSHSTGHNETKQMARPSGQSGREKTTSNSDAHRMGGCVFVPDGPWIVG